MEFTFAKRIKNGFSVGSTNNIYKVNSMKKLYLAFGSFCDAIVSPLANLAARIYVGLIFWKSGVLKFEDMESTIEMFDPAEDGEFVLPFLPPEPAAYLATYGELVLPIMLFLGLFTRVGALGLLIMTAVIQIFVLPDHQHYLWMIILAMLLGQGGGKLSIDYWLFKDTK